MITQKKQFVASAAFTGVLLVACVLLAMNGNLWLDEIITVEHCKEGMAEIISWAARDVHPPLYYILLYFVMLVFGGNVIAMKLLSVAAYCVILLCGLFFVRKYFGHRAMIFFDLFLTGMPYMLYYTVEVRMYEWAMCFVVLCGIAAYFVMTKGRTKDWAGLCVFALLSAYTHYYSFISAVMIFAMLCLWLFVCRDKKVIKNYCITAVITIAGYLPWIPVFLKQTSDVSDGFWITGRGMGYYLSQLFDCGIPYSLYLNILLIAAAFVWLAVKRKNFEKNTFFWAVGCMLIFPVVFLAVYLFSVMISPIIVVRYLLIVMVLLALGIAAVCRYVPKPVFGFVICFYLASAVVMYRGEVAAQNVDAEESMQDLDDYSDNVIYTDIANLDYYLEFYESGAEVIAWGEEGENYGQEVNSILLSAKSAEQLAENFGIRVEKLADFKLKTINAFVYEIQAD